MLLPRCGLTPRMCGPPAPCAAGRSLSCHETFIAGTYAKTTAREQGQHHAFVSNFSYPSTIIPPEQAYQVSSLANDTPR